MSSLPTDRFVNFAILICLIYCGETIADDKKWQIHSDIDLFAFSEVVSIDQFAKDFKDDLVSGKTAFTHDKFEIGARYDNFHVSYIARFDYITEFTEDTAFFHHSEKNLNPLPTNREYNLLLNVDRASAQGIKLGYSWAINDSVSIDFAGTYYYDATDLQSGFAGASGDVEPIDADLIAQFREVTDGLTTDNRNLSPLISLLSDVRLDIDINYAYDEPKFGEKFYRKPIFIGDRNPVITGVNFSEPEGTGYSFNISINWQATDKIKVNADLIDLGYIISWENAPQSKARFSLNPALIDVIEVAQIFVDGGVVAPNEIIDRHVFVEIFNEDFDQHIPWRTDVNAAWLLDLGPSLLGWTPRVSLLGGYFHTSVKDFTRLGIGLNETLQVFYDFGSEAIHLNYTGKYGFAKIVADQFDSKKAHTLGIALGINIRF